MRSSGHSRSFHHLLFGAAAVLAVQALGGTAQAQQSVPYTLDFEAANGGNGLAQGWTVTGTSNSVPAAVWEFGAPTNPNGPGAAASGANVYGTGLTGDYPTLADGALTSPSISLAGTVNPRLTFSHSVMVDDAGFDGGTVQVSINGGTFVTIDGEDPGYLVHPPNVPVAFGGIDALGGDDGWSDLPYGTRFATVGIDLFHLTTPGLIGISVSDSVKVRFLFGSDGSLEGSGWYVDDFRVDTVPTSVTSVAAGTTAGRGTWNRPVLSGFGLSGTGTDVPFDAVAFTVSTSGFYTANATWATHDGMVFLYQGSFSTSTALTNLIDADDDFFPSLSSSNSCVGRFFATGTTYTAVLTGFTNSDSGAYSLLFTGPAAVSLVARPATTPTVASVSPSTGAAAGGTSVTVNGLGFTGATDVRFGAATASFSVVDDAHISATTPPGTGAVTVEVTTPGGVGTKANAFTYIASAPTPTVNTVTPASGTTSGGASVTISGLNFTGASGVTFGGTGATNVSVVSDTTITCVVPAHAAGSVSVVVTTPNGSNGANSLFTYSAPASYSGTTVGQPTFDWTAFGSGTGNTEFPYEAQEFELPAGGSYQITAAWTGFDGYLALYQGSFNPASPGTPSSPGTLIAVDDDFNSSSDSQIIVNLTAGTKYFLVATSFYSTASANPSSGPYTIEIAGPSVATLRPTIRSISPISGVQVGGTLVTISGFRLDGTVGVKFGAATASFTQVSRVTVTATAPSGAPGPVNVEVTTGQGANVGTNTFTYVAAGAAPTVASVSPSRGSTLGGTLVTITGTNFTGASSVTFNGAPATSVSVSSPTEIVCRTPAGSAGVATVVVTTPNGSNTPASVFTYDPPVITAYSGTTVGAPTFSRPEDDGSASTRTNAFEATTLVVTSTAGGDYTITADWASHDGFLVIYSPSFDPANPTANFLAADDDFGSSAASQVVVSLPAGQRIVVVATSYFSFDEGDYQITIEGDRALTFAPIVTGVAPQSGLTTGTTAVSITGSHFTGATGVTFKGLAATGVVVVNDALITCTAPAGGTTGTAAIVVTTAQGGASDPANIFLYVDAGPAPTITSVTPASGSTLGGATVTIGGTGFIAGGTSVKFGSNFATDVVVSSATSLTCTVPTGTAGAAAVEVATARGTQQATLFTYIEPRIYTGDTSGGATWERPDVDSAGAFDVLSGEFPALSVQEIVVPVGGTGLYTIHAEWTGGQDGFLAVYQSAFDPNQQDVNFLIGDDDGPNSTDDSLVTVTLTAGVHYFVVATGFDSGDSGTFQVTIEGPSKVDLVAPVLPVITGLSPTSGLTGAGVNTPVTISGQNFVNVGSVTFGGIAAGNVSVTSSTSITCTAPNQGTAQTGVLVQVTTIAGSSTQTAFTFDYVNPAPPTVASANPSTGPAAGGTSVVITGTNFTGATAVSFGGVSATAFTVNGATQITATTPAHAAGAVSVDVTGPGGTNVANTLFTYTSAAPAPTVTGANPTSGTTAGGTSVVITGTNFTGATAVKFGGTDAASFTVNGATQITATTPAHAAGLVSIDVTTPGGVNISNTLFTFTAPPAPTVTLVAPSSGLTTGGTSVVITGTNFTGATAVRFGGTNATAFTVNGATQITATAPAHAAGAVSVEVTTAGGTSAANTLFTYVAPGAAPVVTSVSPSSGNVSGGNTVTISGTGFTGASGVTFGGSAATSVVVVSDTTITCHAPSHSSGAVAVEVTTPNGTSTSGVTYTYVGIVGGGSGGSGGGGGGGCSAGSAADTSTPVIFAALLALYAARRTRRPRVA